MHLHFLSRIFKLIKYIVPSSFVFPETGRKESIRLLLQGPEDEKRHKKFTFSQIHSVVFEK